MQLVRGSAARPVNQLASFVFDERRALCPVKYPRVTVGDMVFLFERQKHHAPAFLPRYFLQVERCGVRKNVPQHSRSIMSDSGLIIFVASRK